MKIKTNKSELTNLKSHFTAMETINKMKRQFSEWEKNISKESTDEELISKIYKQLMKLSIKNQTNQPKKWMEDLNRHFSNKDI